MCEVYLKVARRVNPQIRPLLGFSESANLCFQGLVVLPLDLKFRL